MSLIFGIYLILILLIVVALNRIISDKKNELEWSELVSTRGVDGKLHPDWDKIGKGCGLFLCLWLPGVYVYSDKVEANGLAVVMLVALAYFGSVSSYSATLRARQGTVETKLETESDLRTTATKTETPKT